MKLHGKVAIVTGGTSGIGLAVSSRFAEEGASVVMASVDVPEVMEEARKEVSAVASADAAVAAVHCDISEPAQIERLVSDTASRFGRIDILVNNAGVPGYGSFLDATPAEWDAIVNVNYRAVFLLSQAAARVMIEGGRGGRIITTSSLGVFTGSEIQTIYCSTKAAVQNLMQSLAVVLGPYGITCNSVAPGVIETPMSRAEFGEPERRASLVNRTVVGRIGEPGDVASAYLYYASDDSAFTTGTFIRVDGGVLINV